MGLLTEYFSATSDDDAAAVLELPGGPLGLRPAPTVVSGNGIEPTVHLGSLEEILTGRPFEDYLPALPQPVAHVETYEVMVTPAPRSTTVALAALAPQDLARAAGAWSETEELLGADPEALADLLRDLAALAREADERGGAVYCWVCV